MFYSDRFIEKDAVFRIAHCIGRYCITLASASKMFGRMKLTSFLSLSSLLAVFTATAQLPISS